MLDMGKDCFMLLHGHYCNTTRPLISVIVKYYPMYVSQKWLFGVQQYYDLCHIQNLAVTYMYHVIERFRGINVCIFSSPEPLGSQGELIGWP